MDAKQTPLIDLRAALAQQAEPTVTEDMKSAVRWAPSSAYWSERLREFFGPDAREGIDALERRLAKAQQAEPVQEPVAWEDWWRNHGQYNFRATAGMTFERAKELMKLAFEVGREAAPPQQAEPVEPVAWLIDYEDGEREVRFVAGTRGIQRTPLYTAPPQRKPLTAQQLDGVIERHVGGSEITDDEYASMEQFARAVEQASWEKNHG